ncbi:FxSxx-COOH system tetratricopeptide repeat protein [Streptomyces sp. SLBN-134]|uniref:FxSxx-COOH system tetratricopeptide repeat protein n=1 Tax=Streptomyces sp. SLBN-134 TaxID=2768456 RepID=UPI00114D5409|nr:FxSxx-COOH system tetratricopeptide repeat protein [Streptomyces sp. SLBN-134]TQL21294.1 tetratricopeptide repeat protein [Streptomyces sp. SLBN-134]
MTDHAQQFFISYAGTDRAWAEWVGWHLEQAGHQVILDVWDWRTGDNFVQRMDEALKRADAVIALFSTSYFEDERWTTEEWTAAVAHRDRLIPLALEPLTTNDLPRILAAKLRKNFHGLDETAALTALREAVNSGSRPTAAPPFPGTIPVTDPISTAGQSKPRLPGSTGQPQVWSVRRRNPDFAGRETEIARLRESFVKGSKSVPQVLHGMGGVGKTQLALEYAHRFADQYDLVWWIDAEQPDEIPVRYTELADRLSIAKPDAGAEANARALLSHLDISERWLLILDNAEDPAQIEPWLAQGPGHTLITSRNPNWAGTARTTPLNVFTRTDSLTYLQGRVDGMNDEQADTLAADLGDLPLALAQAAGVIANGGVSLDLYHQLLATNTTQILEKGGAPGYPAPVAATVTIAVNRLTDHHPDAVALLHLVALLGPEPIRNTWLETVRPRLATIPGDSDSPMWLHEALSPLSRYGLARTESKGFQIHRLTQAVLRDQLPPDQAVAIRNDATTLLAAANPGDPQSPDFWPGWAALTPHLTAHHLAATEQPKLRPTLLDAAHYLIRSGQTRTARDLTAVAYTAWATDLGQDHPDTLTGAQFLGHATADLGEHAESRRIIEDTLARRRRTLGEDHPDTLRSANDLASVLHSLGEDAESRRMDEDTLARRRRTLGDDHPDTLQSAHNLASVLHSLGEHAESRRMNEDTLARRRRTLGEDHPETLRSAHNLASVLHSLGEHAESRRMDEDTLARRRRTLGDDHPDTLRSAHNLAVTLNSLGEHAESRRIIEDTLTRRRRTLGEDHPDILQSAHILASILHDLGEHAESRRIIEDTLTRQRRTLGEDHPDTLQSAQSLASFLNSLGEHAESRRIIEDTLTRQRRTLGEDHPDTLQSAHNLAVTLYNLRKYAAAAQLLEEVRNRRRRTLGDDHPDTAGATHNLAMALTALGRRFEAQRLLAPQKQKKSRFRRKRR